MNKTLIALSVLIVVVIACGQTTPVIPTTDASAIQTSIAATTSSLNLTLQAAVEALPTAPAEQEPAPTQEPPSVPPASGNQYAWNYLGSQDSGGVVIDVARVLIADKSALPDEDFSLFSSFEDKPVVGMIVFKINNTTTQTLSVYPDQGTVIVGGEQIDLTEFFLATFGDNLGGEIFPGVTKIGGIWFGIKRTTLDEIQAITINFPGPHDDSFASKGPDYTFNFDLSNRNFETVPDELK